MAGRDSDRKNDLNEAFRNPDVRAVVSTRGGAGAHRICEELDFDAVRADPKPLIGFSDITHLHMTLWRNALLPSIHGCFAGHESVATAKALMVENAPVIVSSDTTAYSALIHHPGIATGPLIGGNLASLCHMVGAGLPPLEGAILLLEAKRDMGLGRIDRQLTQMKRSGALDGVAGVALGLFTGFDDYEDRGWELADVLRDHLEPLDVPVLGGLKIGHNGINETGEMDQSCVALGAHAVLDADTGTLASNINTR